jgi:hypothetical protein
MQFAARLAHVALGFAIWLVASAAVAQSFPAGSGTLNTRGTFRVSRCDRVPFSGSGMYTLDAAGVLTEVGATPILSTLAPEGSSGRVFSASFDAANIAIVNGILEQNAGLLCGTAFTLASSQITESFKLNKRGTRAKIQQRATFLGTTAFGSHRGIFKAIDRGAWVAAPP